MTRFSFVSTFPWIAVALATAICLFPRLHSPAASAVVLFLAIIALTIARQRVLQTAALFLIGVAAIDLVTFVAARRVNSTFAERSMSHVDREMARVRDEIRDIESDLQTSADRVAASIAAKPDATRARMFHLLARQPQEPGRGMRIVGTNGAVLAWWGGGGKRWSSSCSWADSGTFAWWWAGLVARACGLWSRTASWSFGRPGPSLG